MQHSLDEITSQASSREAGLQLIIQQLRSHFELANVSGLILHLISFLLCICVRAKHTNRIVFSARARVEPRVLTCACWHRYM